MRERVNVELHVITCDLTATAPHLLASAVPWIRITVSKSPFFNKSWKVYVLSHHFAQPTYKLIQRSRPPPPRHPFTSRSPPPLHITPLCVILCTISLTAFSLFFLFPFHFVSLRGCGFGGNVANSICKGDFSIFYVEITLSSFKRTTRLIALIFLLFFRGQK